MALRAVPIALRAFQSLRRSISASRVPGLEVVESKKRLGKAEAFVVFRYVYVGYLPTKIHQIRFSDIIKQ